MLVRYINHPLTSAAIAKALLLHGISNYSMISHPLYLTRLFLIPDDDTLVFSVNDHVSVHIICESIDMWWVFILGLEKQSKRKKQTNKNKPKKHGQIEQHYISFLGLGLNNCIVPMPIITS